MRTSIGVAISLSLTWCAPATAQEALKLCRIIKNDADRLKCYDGLAALSEGLGKPDQTGVPKEWAIEEKRSPLDDSPAVNATLESVEGKSVLLLRCREKSTEAIVAMDRFIECGEGRIRMIYRLDQNQPIETSWSPASSGCRAAFAPSAIPFIRALPDNGRLFMRAHDRKGATYDATFNLGNVSEARGKIAAACTWDASPAAAAPKRPRPAPKAAPPANPN